ncbi:BON domain-containing protein [Actinoplanes bogorensis]|uniref:BON domain-containing protein n=1 Tax=Paractinoplanes bogorensis TaxID=1610840 RepID=A0ABS5YX81_9ACTN|nr:BON domain-containing protein [Actinoplanes bogorensis]MBU2668032.1 BON domain-containing protein [Actinoplanes bogorensis]
MYPFWPYGDDSPRRSTPPDDDHVTVDEALAQRVAEAILQAPLVESGHLHIEVQNGVAILSGSLSSREACDAAADRARETPGVRDVSDQLTVSPARGRKKRG